MFVGGPSFSLKGETRIFPSRGGPEKSDVLPLQTDGLPPHSLLKKRRAGGQLIPNVKWLAQRRN